MWSLEEAIAYAQAPVPSGERTDVPPQEPRTPSLDNVAQSPHLPRANAPAAPLPSAAPAPSAEPGRAADAGLSAREIEVLRLVAQGLTDRDVAERLIVSPRTVHSHLASIYTKLGVTSRGAAVRVALESGLV